MTTGSSFQGQENIPEDGDVIVAVDGRRLNREDDLSDVIRREERRADRYAAGVRGDEERVVEVELGERPARAPSA